MRALQLAVATAGDEVEHLPEDRVLNTDEDQLVAYFVEKFHVVVPELDLNNVVASEHERQLDVYDRYRSESVSVPGTAFDFEIPFVGEPHIFQMRPNTYDTGPPYADIRGQTICFTIAGSNLTAEDIERQYNRNIQSI
jgi:hypothetical protein